MVINAIERRCTSIFNLPGLRALFLNLLYARWFWAAHSAFMLQDPGLGILATVTYLIWHSSLLAVTMLSRLYASEVGTSHWWTVIASRRIYSRDIITWKCLKADATTWELNWGRPSNWSSTMVSLGWSLKSEVCGVSVAAQCRWSAGRRRRRWSTFVTSPPSTPESRRHIPLPLCHGYEAISRLWCHSGVSSVSCILCVLDNITNTANMKRLILRVLWLHIAYNVIVLQSNINHPGFRICHFTCLSHLWFLQTSLNLLLFLPWWL